MGFSVLITHDALYTLCGSTGVSMYLHVPDSEMMVSNTAIASRFDVLRLLKCFSALSRL